MFSKLSISAKLFTIVSFLFLAIAITGGFSFLQMRAINGTRRRGNESIFAMVDSAPQFHRLIPYETGPVNRP